MMTRPPPLDPSLRKLLDSEKENETVSPRASRQAFERVAAKIAGGGGGGGPPPGRPPTSKPPPRAPLDPGPGAPLPKAPLSAGIKGAGLAAVVAALVAITAVSLRRPGSEHEHVPVPVPVGSPAAPALGESAAPPTAPLDEGPPLVSPETPATAPAIEKPPAAATTSTAPRPTTSKVVDRSADRSLVEERALLDDARRARARGDDDGAIASAMRHESRFPHGQLADEREAILIQALAHANRMDEARRRADRFRARSPRSILLPVVEAAVGGKR